MIIVWLREQSLGQTSIASLKAKREKRRLMVGNVLYYQVAGVTQSIP